MPLLIFAALMAVSAWNVAFQLAGDAATMSPPGRSFATIDGNAISLAHREGRPMVLNLWASWCPPCRREMPMMAEVAAGLNGVDMVFANQGEAAGTIVGYLREQGLSLATVVTDPAHALMAQYDVRGLPATLFIGADGTVQSAHLGEISRAQLLSEIDRLRSAE